MALMVKKEADSTGRPNYQRGKDAGDSEVLPSGEPITTSHLDGEARHVNGDATVQHALEHMKYKFAEKHCCLK
jgi:hypothetical protein